MKFCIPSQSFRIFCIDGFDCFAAIHGREEGESRCFIVPWWRNEFRSCCEVFFFPPLYHGTSLLINILIREQMTRNTSHFSILHAFNIAGTTMPRLVVEEDTCIFCESTDWGIWPQVMFDCLLSGSWVPEFSSHLCMKFWEVEMFATISSCWDNMWVLSPLQQVVLRLDGISPNLSHNLDLRGERLL